MLRKVVAFFLACVLAFIPAVVSAQMLTMNYGDDGNSPNLTPTDNACLAVSGTTQTFTGKNLGAPGASRVNIVSISWVDSTNAGTAELTGVTIGGVTATRASRAQLDNQNSNAEIWYANVPNGATGNIVITSSTNIDEVTIQVYRLIKFNYGLPTAVSIGTTSASVSVTSRQAVIGVSTRSNSASTTLSNLTLDYGHSCGSTQYGTHSSTFPTSAGTLTTTINPTTNSPIIALSVWDASCLNAVTITSGTLDGLGATGAWSTGRKLVSAYGKSLYDINTNGTINTLYDQTGNGNDAANIGGRPTMNVATCSNTAISGMSIIELLATVTGQSSMITTTDGYMIGSFKLNSFTTNNATGYLNAPIMQGQGQNDGVTMKGTAGSGVAIFGNYPPDVSSPAGSIVTGTPYVVEWWHTSGTLFGRVNMGTPVSVAAGNTTLGNSMYMGGYFLSSSNDGFVYEFATFNSVPSSPTRDAIAASFMAAVGAH